MRSVLILAVLASPVVFADGHGAHVELADDFPACNGGQGFYAGGTPATSGVQLIWYNKGNVGDKNVIVDCDFGQGKHVIGAVPDGSDAWLIWPHVDLVGKRGVAEGIVLKGYGDGDLSDNKSMVWQLKKRADELKINACLADWKADQTDIDDGCENNIRIDALTETLICDGSHDYYSGKAPVVTREVEYACPVVDDFTHKGWCNGTEDVSRQWDVCNANYNRLVTDRCTGTAGSRKGPFSANIMKWGVDSEGTEVYRDYQAKPGSCVNAPPPTTPPVTTPPPTTPPVMTPPPTTPTTPACSRGSWLPPSSSQCPGTAVEQTRAVSPSGCASTQRSVDGTKSSGCEFSQPMPVTPVKPVMPVCPISGLTPSSYIARCDGGDLIEEAAVTGPGCKKATHKRTVAVGSDCVEGKTGCYVVKWKAGNQKDAYAKAPCPCFLPRSGGVPAGWKWQPYNYGGRNRMNDPQGCFSSY